MGVTVRLDDWSVGCLVEEAGAACELEGAREKKKKKGWERGTGSHETRPDQLQLQLQLTRPQQFTSSGTNGLPQLVCLVQAG